MKQKMTGLNEKLRAKIIKEMVIEDEESWKLAKEIFTENVSRLKPNITVLKIYERIRALKMIEERNKGK